MTHAIGVAIVPEQVARHPVTQAILRARLREAATELLLKIHLQEDGTEQRDMLSEARLVLTVAAALDPEIPGSASARESVDTMCCDDFRWRTAAAPELDSAIETAMAHILGAPAVRFGRAVISAAQLLEKSL